MTLEETLAFIAPASYMDSHEWAEGETSRQFHYLMGVQHDGGDIDADQQRFLNRYWSAVFACIRVADDYPALFYIHMFENDNPERIIEECVKSENLYRLSQSKPFAPGEQEQLLARSAEDWCNELVLRYDQVLSLRAAADALASLLPPIPTEE